MPVSSTPSKRVALAPINVNVACPFQNYKNRHQNTNKSTSLPLTPSLTPKIGLVKSMSTLAPSSTCSTVGTGAPARKMESFSGYKITTGRNVKADLAATKLKFRLQLALYNVRQNRDASVASVPNFRVTKPRSSTSLSVPLKTSLSRSPSFTRSANVNLQKPKLTTRAPRLNAVASAKTAGAAAETNLKLYHIKPSSAFYNTYEHRLPLTNTHSQRLPPVNKILRTPIKAASRVLSQMGNVHAVSNSDETIDETADETCVGESMKKRSDILGSSPLRCNSYGSGIGTPNSFSVAKSLLQLGSGFY